MPNYDYQCRECGTVTEVFHKMSQEPEVKCPDCESPMKRKISAGAGIMFKGSGYYVNDYKSSGGKAEAAAETGTPPVKKTETKTDAAAAAKTETKTEAAPAVKAGSPEPTKA
jgi:putative FmdB family regulatory protein